MEMDGVLMDNPMLMYLAGGHCLMRHANQCFDQSLVDNSNQIDMVLSKQQGDG